MAIEPITEPGIYALTNEEYHADPVPGWSLSSSGARKLCGDDPPAVFYEERINPPPKTAALEFGTAAHQWLLEGDKWRERYHVLPDGNDARTAKGKSALAEAFLNGKEPIKAEDFATIQGMKAALEAHSFAMAAFSGEGRPETAIFWRDRHTGVMCRCKPDFVPRVGRIFPDYKTTKSLRDDDLRRSIGAYGYHCQASWYMDGILAAELAADPVMLFVFQEKKKPFLVRCVTIGAPSMIAGEGLNYRARRIFAECTSTGVWPGYPDQIEQMDIPTWDLAKAERALARDEEDEARAAA